MARAYQERVQGNAQVPSTGQTVGLNGSVAPIATPTYVPGSNPMLDIAQGLSSLSPSLARIAQDQMEKDRRQAVLDAKAQAERDAIDAEKQNLAQPDMTNVPFAVRSDYALAYKESIANKAGAEAAREMMDRYQAEHTQPDFNFAKFIGDFKQKELAGVQDSQFVVGLGAHIERAAEHLSGAYREYTQKKVDAEARSNLSVELGEITSAASPESNWVVFNRNAEKYAALGITRAEVAAMAFEKAQALSAAAGGDPRVFEMFEQVDPVTGKTPIDMNPKLADNVAKAKREAEAQWQHTFDKENLSTYVDVRATHQEALHTGKLDGMSYKDVSDMIKAYEGPTGVYRGNERVELMNQWLRRQAEKSVIAMMPRLAAQGTAHMGTEKAQKDFLAYTLATPYARLQEAIANGGDGNHGEAIAAIVNTLATGGFNVADEKLVGMVKAAASAVPKDASSPPTARFNATVDLYRQLKASTNPGLINRYFDEDSRHMVETYLAGYQGAGVDNTSAYQAAYKAIDPATKALVAERLKDPAVISKIHSDVRSVVPLLSRVGTKLNPFADPIDFGVVEQRAEIEARRVMMQNPQMSKDDLHKHLESWATENFYRDPTTDSFVQMPPAMNTKAAQEAVSNYLGLVVKYTNTGDQDRKPRLRYISEDKYELMQTNPIRTLGTVSLNDISKLHYAMTQVSPEERQALKDLRDGLVKGTVGASQLEEAKPLLTKARAAGMWDGGELEVRAWNRSDPGTSAVYSQMVSPLKDGWKPKFVRPDSPTTRGVVEQFMQAGNTGAALTAMAEGVRLTAYNDPAVGRNIGIGYNMDKNAKTLPEDFRRAGIPANSVEGVVNGTVSITPQQAMRLYEVVRPRYESMAEKAVEKRAPGEWQKLPRNAREVLIDMAYQTGNKVGDFEKGITALLKGDLTGAGLETTYVDRKSGTRKVDERRHSLRTSLLSSTNNFQTVINHASRLPANAYESRVAALR